MRIVILVNAAIVGTEVHNIVVIATVGRMRSLGCGKRFGLSERVTVDHGRHSVQIGSGMEEEKWRHSSSME